MGDRVATERTVVRNPAMNDPNAGVIVAKGDPLPEGAAPPYVENTPNKVDAAANHEVADAADQAQNPTPAGPIVARPPFGNSVADAELAAAQERTAANRDKFAEDMRALADAKPVEASGVAPEPETPGHEGPQDVAYLTVVQLDALAAERDVADYPKGGNKAEKVAAVKAAGITEA